MPPEFTEPGETCLEITAEPGPAGIGKTMFYKFGPGEGVLLQSAPSRRRIPGRGLAPPGRLGRRGQVRFALSGQYAPASQKKPWQVTGQWRHFTYDFTGPEYPKTNGHMSAGISFTGPGKLWVDNLLLYRYDQKHGFAPFGPHEVGFDEFMDSVPATGPKPALRSYGLCFERCDLDVDVHQLRQFPLRRLLAVRDRRAAAGHVLAVHELVPADGRFARHAGARPYLTVVANYTEDEWTRLVEWLGVPYDPQKDTPQSKPAAWLRYKHRGHGRPWTDDFREIVIEYGNETWHQGLFGWDGFGRPGYVHFGGREYGLFARYMFRDIGRQDARLERAGAGQEDQVHARLALRDAPRTATARRPSSRPATASVTSGTPTTWGPNGKPTTPAPRRSTTTACSRRCLGGYYMNQKVRQWTANATGTQRQVRHALPRGGLRGRTQRLLAQPGQSPGGRVVRQVGSHGTGRPGHLAVFQPVRLYLPVLPGLRQRHLVEFAHAAGAGRLPPALRLDGPEDAQQVRPGQRDARRPRPTRTPVFQPPQTTRRPSRLRTEEDIPLVAAYAIRGGKDYSVFVLSRKLDGKHDGLDFGDGYTPVDAGAAVPPRRAASRSTSWRMPDGTPADPRENNFDHMKVVIVSQEIPAENFAGRLPLCAAAPAPTIAEFRPAAYICTSSGIAAKDRQGNKCRLSLRESSATFAERKATMRQLLIRRFEAE